MQKNLYEIRRADAPPRLDGRLDAPEWLNAESLEIGWFHPAGSAHRPQTLVRVLYTAEALHVAFRVKDRFVRAVRTHYQDPVWKDSCVEFFVQPKSDKGYFNFETNCLGAMLLSYVEDPARTPAGLARATPVPAELASHISIYHSLKGPIIQEMTAATTWTVQYSVPFALFERYVGPLGKVAGQYWRGNFYKCAEDNSHPHWASWQPLAEEVNFHRPDLFGSLRLSP